MVPSGNRLSASDQRRSWRQSTCGTKAFTCVIGMSSGALTLQHAKRDGTSPSGLLRKAAEASAHDAVIQRCLERTVHRCIRDCCQPVESIADGQLVPGAILK